MNRMKEVEEAKAQTKEAQVALGERTATVFHLEEKLKFQEENSSSTLKEANARIAELEAALEGMQSANNRGESESMDGKMAGLQKEMNRMAASLEDGWRAVNSMHQHYGIVDEQLAEEYKMNVRQTDEIQRLQSELERATATIAKLTEAEGQATDTKASSTPPLSLVEVQSMMESTITSASESWKAEYTNLVN